MKRVVEAEKVQKKVYSSLGAEYDPTEQPKPASGLIERRGSSNNSLFQPAADPAKRASFFGGGKKESIFGGSAPAVPGFVNGFDSLI